MKNKKIKIKIYYNNEYLDILSSNEILNFLNINIAEDMDYFRCNCKNGWIYELIIGNISLHKQQEEYTTFYFTDFDILKITPIEYVGESVITQSEKEDIEREFLLKYKKTIQELVSSQNKDGKNWVLGNVFGDFGIHQVEGNTFTMYSLILRIDNDLTRLTRSNLDFILSECKRFFNIE